MVGIIDYGLGNPISIQNMIKKVGGSSFLSSDAEKLTKADQLILPGVGHFSKGMENLKSSGLDEIIKSEAINGKPILGICLGAQLLTNHSEEGNLDGLGLIPINTKKFVFEDNTFKVPNMGWSGIEIKLPHPYLINFHDTPRFYLVHSYYMENSIPEYVVAESQYGHSFASVVANKNVVGMQFHPEKSHKFGMQVFRNFLEL